MAMRGQAGPNARIAVRLGVVVAAMLALSFAAVPFYDWFCKVTGYGGATATAEAPTGPIRDEVVSVRFDANVAPGLAMTFRPAVRTVEARLDEPMLIHYVAENRTDHAIAGAASYNVTPSAAGLYFAKVSCFCFELQVLQPGERVEMPVSFFIDPAMLEDVEARGVRHITLSYTMHPAEVPAEFAAAAEAGQAARTN